MADTPQPEPITCKYDPDVEQVESWLRKMISEGRFVELVAAVLALIVRLRDLNTQLMRRLAHLKRKRPPSETLERVERQLVLPFPGTQKPARKKRARKKRRRRRHPGRRALPSHLERVVEHNVVPAHMRTCPQCGQPMLTLGHESCEVLDIRPAEFFISVRIDETVYCPKDDTVVSAPPPNRIVPRGKLGDTLIIEALADKYLLHLPIERQCANWARQGLDLPPHTLGRSVGAAIDLLAPLADCFLEQARQSEILSIDATSIRLLDPTVTEGRRTGTMWCGIGDGRWVAFQYWPDGSHKGAVELIGTRTPTGRKIQCDGTSTTNFIETGGGQRPGCWAHARRKLVEAARSGDTLALEGLQIIAKLFTVEKVSVGLHDSPEARRARRQEHSTRVLHELRAWVDLHSELVPPKSPLGKAITYLRRQWDRLVLFLEDGRLEATNNHVERSIRPLVQGQKNWLFAYGDDGAKRTATILTVLGTCVAQEVNPRAFLHKALELIVAGGDDTDFEALTPDQLAARFPELRMPARASPEPDETIANELVEGLETISAPRPSAPESEE